MKGTIFHRQPCIVFSRLVWNMEMKGTIFHLQPFAVFSKPVWNKEMKGTIIYRMLSLIHISEPTRRA